MTNSTHQSATTGFFDLHITGLGYLNRIREVRPKRGDAFWACDIAALNGPADDVGYTRFDCRISGHEAEALVKRCRQAVYQGRKVLVGFKLGDLWTDTFVYSRGDKAGQTGVSLKARLLFISWIKVNGEMVYQAPRRDEQGAGNDRSAASAEQPEVGNGYAAALSGEAAGSFDSPAMH
ncbi:STY4534 family ICE replication protein [Halomonas sp. C05BenzN]|uniref:STY4534 family ICE replication protein n=1 Tax=Halomonas sp. C05BenzN TaxID=3411041 RepID=UPI003B9513BA